MKRQDICIIKRTSTITDTITHRVTNQNATYPSTGSYPCRFGRTAGSVTQGQPQGIYIQTPRLYIDIIVNPNIKQGDILILNSKTKYIVSNVYTPYGHHYEIDLTYKEEV